MVSLTRIWRSRGHGVHSPLAYGLIVNTLCVKHVAYYEYERVQSARGRRLLRIVEALRPVATVPKQIDYAAISDVGETPTVEMWLDGGATALWGEREQVLPRATGLSFSDSTGETLVVNRHDLARQHFEVRFR